MFTIDMSKNVYYNCVNAFKGDGKMEMNGQKTKFCKHCCAKIPEQAVICTSCGGQVEMLQREQIQQPSVVINNANANQNINQNHVGGRMYKREKNKWVAFFLCFFLPCQNVCSSNL